MTGERDDYAYINENIFRNGGRVEYCVFQEEKNQWEEAGDALLIGFHLCLENAPISFSRGKAAGIKKTNKGLYTIFENQNMERKNKKTYYN